jgi:hypothetical protein
VREQHTRIARGRSLFLYFTYGMHHLTLAHNLHIRGAGWHSLCVDASFLANKNTGSWGAIIRDEKGDTIVSVWDIIPFCENAEAAESMAFLQGTKLALTSVHSSLLVQSDCASLIIKLSS